MIKNNRGVTLIALTIVVIIILTITGMLVYSAKDSIYVKNLTNMQNDIANLRDKVSLYYSEYGKIPAQTEYTDVSNLQAAGVIGANDTGKFLIIELEILDGLTLNYGKDYERYKANDYENITDLTDIYIINENSNNIFYVQGVGVQENNTTKMYYTDYTEGDTEEVALKKIVDWHEETNEEGETIITNGLTELKIGDYVDYDPQAGATKTEYRSSKENNGYGEQIFQLASYQYGWRVLGVDEETNEILLVSEDYIGPDSTELYYGRTYFKMMGKNSYEKGIDELNTICELFGQGKGASKARSLTIEDINKITGYEPEKTKFREGTVLEYGKEVTYYWDGTNYPLFKVKDGIEGKLEDMHNEFTWYDQQTNMWKSVPKSDTASAEKAESIVTIKNDMYAYSPSTLTEDTKGEEVGIAENSEMYKLLFENSENSAIEESKKGTTDGCSYYLASKCNAGDKRFVRFMIRVIDPGMVSGYTLYTSTSFNEGQYYGVRPIVSLQSNINIFQQDGTLTNPHEIL